MHFLAYKVLNSDLDLTGIHFWRSSWKQVGINSGNGLVLRGGKPLPKPMMSRFYDGSSLNYSGTHQTFRYKCGLNVIHNFLLKSTILPLTLFCWNQPNYHMWFSLPLKWSLKWILIYSSRLEHLKDIWYILSVCYLGIILCMRPANERWCYTVTPSVIGWAHTQNDPYYCMCTLWMYLFIYWFLCMALHIHSL